KAVIVVLIISAVLGGLRVYFGTQYPAYLLGLPYALYFAGRFVFRLRIPREKVLNTIKEGVLALKTLPKEHQSTAMILLRDEISKRLHDFAPLMQFNINGILDGIYYVGFLGTAQQIADTNAFLDELERDLLNSTDSRTMLEVVKNCKLRSGILPADMAPSFGWEKKTDWKRRLGTAGTVIIVVTSVLGTLVSLKII